MQMKIVAGARPTARRAARLSLLGLLGLVVVLATGCARKPADPPAAAAGPAEQDPHSYAEPDRVRTTDLALELKIDFDARRISGTATHSLEWLDAAADRLLLDTRDLEIDEIEGLDVDGRWVALDFALADQDSLLGRKLAIEMPARNPRVRIVYSTSPAASGLQWLTPEMTAGKRTPFMFSQSQAIHARSWVPLQDTPRVRFRYRAEITAPADAMVLMSADNDPAAQRDGSYSFEMREPIPSYLLAIAAGDLVFRPISHRSGVWAEAGMVEAAAAEFADVEKMMAIAERLYGPYRWGRYDMLVLPPSFPFGGMENPRLSFITPTVITGDRSQVSVIAHELAHSWSGNLVTNSTASDGWLNEGFTSYVENRIVEELYGKERSDIDFVIARNELRAEFEDLPAEEQVLRPEKLANPDNVSSVVVYDKGAWFLQFLEQRYGRQAFDEFLRGYFNEFAFQSVTTATFLDHLDANLATRFPGRVSKAELDEWLYHPGVPAGAPATASPRLAAIDGLRQAWLATGELPAPAVTARWTTPEWVHLLEGMPDALGVEQMAALDAAYELTGTPNGEVGMRWYALAVRSGYSAADEAMAAFLQRVGRRKLIIPVYEELVKTTQGREFGREVLAKARPGYHPITTASVEALFDEPAG